MNNPETEWGPSGSGEARNLSSFWIFKKIEKKGNAININIKIESSKNTLVS
jgi:hypothetical protein